MNNICPLCNRNFYTQTRLNQHYNRKTPCIRVYNCIYCNITLNKLGKFKLHIKTLYHKYNKKTSILKKIKILEKKQTDVYNEYFTINNLDTIYDYNPPVNNYTTLNTQINKLDSELLKLNLELIED